MSDARQYLNLDAYLGTSVSTRDSVRGFFDQLPFHGNFQLNLAGITFLARNAAQEMVNHIELRARQGQSIQLINAQPEVQQMLKIATKKNDIWDGLFLGAGIVATGLLIAHIADSKQVKKLLKDF